jgi:hypothetical protein
MCIDSHVTSVSTCYAIPHDCDGQSWVSAYQKHESTACLLCPWALRSMLQVHIENASSLHESYHLRWRMECNPSLSVTSATFIAFGRSCLLANTSKTASLSSSCMQSGTDVMSMDQTHLQHQCLDTPHSIVAEARQYSRIIWWENEREHHQDCTDLMIERNLPQCARA